MQCIAVHTATTRTIFPLGCEPCCAGTHTHLRANTTFQQVSATSIFSISAAIAALQFLIDVKFLQETLPPSKRSTKPITSPNPFDALKIFTKGSRGLKTMVAVAVLQCMPEGKNTADLFTVRVCTHAFFDAFVVTKM
jgi:hypothetical protein